MRRIGVAIVVLAVVGLALAQTPAGPPKPGPEQKRMAYFVGRWTSEGEMKASPLGPAGKFTFDENCQWLSGGFFVTCNSSGKGSMGDVKGIAIMGYDPEEEVYTYYEVNSMGEGMLSKGTVNGKVWTWTSEAKMGGKPTKSRFTLTEDTANSQSYKFEISMGDGPMQLVMEGKSTRVPNPPKKK